LNKHPISGLSYSLVSGFSWELVRDIGLNMIYRIMLVFHMIELRSIEYTFFRIYTLSDIYSYTNIFIFMLWNFVFQDLLTKGHCEVIEDTRRLLRFHVVVPVGGGSMSQVNSVV